MNRLRVGRLLAGQAGTLSSPLPSPLHQPWQMHEARSVVRFAPRFAAASPTSAGGKTLVYYPTEKGARKWARELLEASPDLDLQVAWEEAPGEPSRDTTFAVVWKPPRNLLAGHPSLLAVQLTGAGVDAVLPACPTHIPVARIVDPVMSERMATYVLCQCLNLMRRTDDYIAAQRAREWRGALVEEEKDVGEVHVGVMGLGGMGGTSAGLLSRTGFQVRGWVRGGGSPREVPGVAVHEGEVGLGEFLTGLDILVCLLPLTPDTRGIINAELLSKLPAGACVVNAARGAHLVEADLLDALDTGHIRQAVLDVFEEEPLPQPSPLWAHPHVRVTPHVSAKTNIKTSVGQVLENRRRALEGEAPLLNQVELGRGY